MTLLRCKCTCGGTPCWHKLAACCTEADDLYITCSVAAAAGISPIGEGQTYIKYEGQCYVAEIYEETTLPDGAVVVGVEIVGNVEFFDDCGEDAGGCCEPPGCWYVARACCDPTLACEEGFDPPTEFYIDCEVLDAQIFAEELPALPITYHPPYLDQFPDCIPCYTIDVDDTVDELPDGAVEADPPAAGDLVDDCEDEECCPEAEDGGCETACAMPTHVTIDVVPTAASSGGCLCDPPATPQSWLIGNFSGSTLACTAESAVSSNGCGLLYQLTFACVPVVEETVLVAIFYRVSLAFEQAATIGPDDPDCGDCGYSLPGFQTCADPCGTSHTFILRTPDLPITSCPHPEDFTILESSLNISGTPTILGFDY